jgi:2'-5' RNA ligase
MSIRLFAALEIPDAQAGRLGSIMQGVGGARWRPRENLHITLRFYGEVTEPVAAELDAELDRLSQGFGPFDVALKGAGFFGGSEPHALWIGVAENENLRALAAACERAARRCGLKAEARKFAPHVTVAYLHNARLERVIAFEKRFALFELPPWRVEGFALFSSVVRNDGPSHYSEEAFYPLLGRSLG